MGIEDNVGEEYDKRFTEQDKDELNYFGVRPCIANRYPERFDGRQITILFEAGFSPEQAKTVESAEKYCSNQ